MTARASRRATRRWMPGRVWRTGRDVSTRPAEDVQAGTYCPDVVVQSASVTRRCRVAARLLAGHHYYVVNAAHASEDGGQASLGGVASTIRQVIRL